MQQSEKNLQDESKRIEVLKRYEILDTPPDGSFDHMTEMVAELLKMPIAIVSLVDTDRIWFKSSYGIDMQEIDRDPGLCASAILSNEIYEVKDARNDPRTLSNPLVAGDFGLQFYAAVPLTTREGFNLGTLCVIDKKPRTLNSLQRKILKDIAQLVMHQMEMRLEARMAIKQQYEILNSTAHDLKNPLSIMPLLADMLIVKKDNPKAISDIAAQIKSAGKRMNKTIDELLEIAIQDTGMVQLRLKEINFSKIIKGVVSTNKALAQRKNQKINTQIPDTCLIYGDDRRITEIVDNLLNNAIKYSPFEKDIFISLKVEDDRAVMEVKDNGPGLTEDDIKNLFRKFISLSAQPTGGEKSTGMGLSIVKQWVDAHHGKIHAVSNKETEGATFTVELPLAT